MLEPNAVDMAKKQLIIFSLCYTFVDISFHSRQVMHCSAELQPKSLRPNKPISYFLAENLSTFFTNFSLKLHIKSVEGFRIPTLRSKHPWGLTSSCDYSLQQVPGTSP